MGQRVEEAQSGLTQEQRGRGREGGRGREREGGRDGKKLGNEREDERERIKKYIWVMYLKVCEY